MADDGPSRVEVGATPLVVYRCPIVAVAWESLPAAEREQVKQAGPQRQAEWYAGRRAARAALATLLGVRADDIVIDRAADGAPAARGAAGLDGVRLSITHGKRSAVAAVGRVGLLGVDLCDLVDAPRVERVAKRFISDGERELAVAAATPRAWSTLWALKEAGAKALRRGLFDGGLKATRIDALEPAHFAEPALAALVVVGAADAVALVWAL